MLSTSKIGVANATYSLALGGEWRILPAETPEVAVQVVKRPHSSFSYTEPSHINRGLLFLEE